MRFTAHHEESSIPALKTFIQENPLGILTTAIPSQCYHFIQSSHIPWVLDTNQESNGLGLGRLRGHMARQNPQSKAMIDQLKSDAQGSGSNNQLKEHVMVLFNGPVHHYVTANFYTETKPVTGKVVPTWNYSAVQVYGKATLHYDAKAEETSAYLDQQIGELTEQSEGRIMGYRGGDTPEPWKVSDAPAPYTEIMKKAIIGIEIEITSIEGKYKMSQEMGKGDRDGTVKGFRDLGTDLGEKMAKTIEEKGELIDLQKKNRALNKNIPAS